MTGRPLNATLAAALTVALSIFGGLSPAHAGKAEKADRIVAKAADTVDYFTRDDSFTALWDLADQAKAVVVIPRSVRAGFIFGGSAGDAVLTARNDDGTWSQPSFMTVGSFSFGFQAGGEASEIVLLVMSQRGMEQLLSSSVKLGADLTVAAGPVGAGAKAQTTDILAFSRSRGLYGGISLEGAVLKVRHSYNQAYYGAPVSPVDIIYKKQVFNPRSEPLQKSVSALVQRGLAGAKAPGAGQDQSAAATVIAPVEVRREEADYEDDTAWGAPVKSGPDGR